MFKIILEKILPLYILIFVGFLFGKRKKYDLSYVSDIVLYFFSPILVFVSFYKLEINFPVFNLILANISYIFLSLFLLSYFFKKIYKEKYKAIALSLTFSNVAYLGLPLVYFLYGEKGFNIAIINFIVISILHFSLGLYFLTGRVKDVFKLPFIFAVVLAMLFKKLKIVISASFMNLLELTGKSSLPLMLTTLGTRLSQVKFEDIKYAFILSIFKVFFSFILLLFISKIFSLPGIIKNIFILQNILPSAILNYVFCEKYNQSPSLVSSIVFFSTLLSFFYIPIILILLKI